MVNAFDPLAFVLEEYEAPGVGALQGPGVPGRVLHPGGLPIPALRTAATATAPATGLQQNLQTVHTIYTHTYTYIHKGLHAIVFLEYPALVAVGVIRHVCICIYIVTEYIYINTPVPVHM